MKRHAKIEIFPGRDGQHYYRVRAANGEILAVSEGFVSKGNARRAAKSLIRAIDTALIVEVQ